MTSGEKEQDQEKVYQSLKGKGGGGGREKKRESGKERSFGTINSF